MVGYDLRPYAPGDEEAILATFNLVFGADDPGFVPRTLSEWRHAYLANPSGTRVWVAMQDGACAAHYASQPYRTRVDGEERVFAQIIDSMVHPDHRRGLKRPGLFVELGRRMLAETCGPDRDLVTFGMPVAEAWRIGKTFLRYELVRRQLVLAREPGGGPEELPDGVRELARAPSGALDLYERCAVDWGASTVRDAAHLDWRFHDHPRHDYRMLVVGSDESPDGLAVFRASDWPMPGSGLVCDWLVPHGGEEAGALLRDALLACARQAGAHALLAVLPPWDAWFPRFQEAGFRVHSLHYPMSGRDNDPVHTMTWLRDRWWYTFAEVDLV